MAYLGPPPLEGLEEKYRDVETEMKEKSGKRKAELTKLDSKQRAV